MYSVSLCYFSDKGEGYSFGLVHLSLVCYFREVLRFIFVVKRKSNKRFVQNFRVPLVVGDARVNCLYIVRFLFGNGALQWPNSFHFRHRLFALRRRRCCRVRRMRVCLRCIQYGELILYVILA